MASVATDIVNAMIAALGTEGITAVDRKVPARREGEELPLTCLVQLAEEAEYLTFEAEAGVETHYPVLVVTIFAGTGKLADGAAVRTVRQTIRRTFMRTGGGLGLSGVLGADYDPRPPFDSALIDKGYDWTAQLFRFEVVEDLDN